MPTLNNNKLVDMKQMWQKMEDFPIASSAISAMAASEDGESRYIYYLVGSAFYRYDAYANNHIKLASPLVTPTVFASLRYSKFSGTNGRVISSPSSTSVRLAGLNAGLYDGFNIRITNGAGTGQVRKITATSAPVKYEQGLATSGTTAYIGDNTKKWKVNQWAGYQVRLTYSTGATIVRKILYNDTNTVYVSDANYQPLDSFNNSLFTATPSTTAGSQTSFVIEASDVTVDTAWDVQPDYSSRFKIESGGLWLFTSAAAAPFASLQYYDEIADIWMVKTVPTNIFLAAFGVDGTIERTGEIGGIYETGTASSGSTYLLADSTKNMIVGQYDNFRIRITSGTGAGQQRRIIKNTATTIEVARKWDINPDATSVYEIIADKDKFYLMGNGQAFMLQYDVDSDLLIQGAKYDDGIACNLSAQLLGIDNLPIAITSGTRATGGILTANIAAAGTGYVVGEIITLATGSSGKVIVTSTGVGGTVTGIQVHRAGSGYSVATFAQSATTGVGTGFTCAVASVGIACTVTTAVNHNFKVGDVVKLSGDANYAGNVTITGVDSLTVFNFTTAAAGNMTAAATQSATVIVDCTKNWTINEHVGKILQTHLVGTAGIVQPRVIVSNTATTITVATITTALVNGTSRYVIVDSSMFGRDEQYKVEAKKNVGMATGGSTTTLVDSTKYWDTNQWVGARIRIKSGTGRDAYFTITSNTATTLTYAAQTFTPDATTNYIIQDTFGVCTGAGSTTTIVDTTKTWAVNQWAGKKVRLTGGAGFGLTAAANEVLIVSNTANTLTFTAITGLAPDATTTYTILGIPNRGAGIELIWLFGGISAGKRMIVARGSGSNTADMYDVSKEVWEYSMYFNPQMELMNAGTYYAYDGVDGVYFAPSTGTNTVQYIQKFDIKTSRIVGLGSIPTLQGAMVAGNRMEIIKSPSGISYLYVNKNSSTELLRVPIWF